jgi:hypothetical protein
MLPFNFSPNGMNPRFKYAKFFTKETEGGGRRSVPESKIKTAG